MYIRELNILLLVIFLAVPVISSRGQDRYGLGARAGSINGVTGSMGFANTVLELSVGRTIFPFSENYKNFFWTDYLSDEGLSSDSYRIVEAKAGASYSVQLRWLVHKGFDGQKAGRNTWIWYYGAGFQAGGRKINYKFRIMGGPENVWRLPDKAIGIDGVIGLQYLLKNRPIVIFLDGNLMIEFIDNPISIWPQISAGGRWTWNRKSSGKAPGQ